MKIFQATIFVVMATLAGTPGASAQSVQQAEIVASTSHAGGIIAVDISEDGRLVVSSSEDGTIKLWDASSGKLIRTYVGTEGGSNVLKFRPGGDAFVATGTGSRQPARIFSALSSKTLKSLPLAIPPDSAGYLRGGKALYFGSEFRWDLWDVPSWRKTKEADRDTPSSRKSDVITNIAVFGGRAILLSSAKEIPSRLVDEETFNVIRKYSNSQWNSACFIDNGARFIAVSVSYSDDKTTLSAYAYDTSTGQRLQKIDMQVEKIACAPGKSVAYLADGAINVLTGTGQRIGSRRIQGAFKAEGKLALSADGSLAVYGDPRDARVELWSVETGRLLRAFAASGIAAADSFRISDRLSAVVAKNFVAQLDIASGQVASVFQNDADITAARPFAGRMVVGDKRGRVRIVDLASNKPVREINLAPGDIRGLAASVRKDRIAAIDKDYHLTVLEASSGRTISRMQLEKPDPDAVFYRGAPRILPSHLDDEFFVAEGDSEASINRISFDSGRLVKTTKLEDISEPGMVVSSGVITKNSGTGGQDQWPMRLVSLETGKNIRQVDTRPEDRVAAASVMDTSTDGRTVFVGRSDASIDQIDIASGRFLRTFAAHNSSVSSVRMVAPERIVSTSGDGLVNIWDSRTGSLLASTMFFSATDWLTITPEGFFDISSSRAARYLSIVRGLDVSSVDQLYNVLYRPDMVREKLAGDPGGKVRAAAAQLDLDKVMASGNPPRVEFAGPVSGPQVLGDQATVEAVIVDQGGGLGKVEWRVNGITLGVEERGVGRTDQGSANAIRVSRTLGLTPGENRIAVLAYNGAGLIASVPAEITVTSAQQQGSVKPRLHVLTVGVNDYWDSALRLSFAAPDAKAVSDGLKRAGDKLYERVEITTVLDADATAEKLDAVFGEMAKQVRPQDVFVFFLAGHGKTVDARFYFLPQDFRYTGEDSITAKGIGQDRLQEWFSRIKAQKSVLLFDACESGSLIGDRIAMRGIEEKTAIDRMTRAMGRTMLTATTASKPAIEGYRGHGVFTYTLLAGFDAADANGDGIVEVTELATYIDRRLPDLTYDAFKLRQVPQMRIVGSNFPLASKVALLPADSIRTAAPAPPVAVAAKPTHVVIAPADVYEQLAGKGGKREQLSPGTLLSLVKTEQGWVLVARDGKQIGYVAEDRLMRVQ